MKIKNLSQLIVELYEKLSSWEEDVVKDSGLTTTQAVLAYTAVAALIGMLAIFTGTSGKTYVFLGSAILVAGLFTLLTRALGRKGQSA